MLPMLAVLLAALCPPQQVPAARFAAAEVLVYQLDARSAAALAAATAGVPGGVRDEKSVEADRPDGSEGEHRHAHRPLRDVALRRRGSPRRRPEDPAKRARLGHRRRSALAAGGDRRREGKDDPGAAGIGAGDRPRREKVIRYTRPLLRRICSTVF